MNILGDFAGGGMFAVLGIMIALQERLKSGLFIYIYIYNRERGGGVEVFLFLL